MGRDRQVVVVTGASGGIGRATARAFGARAAKVALLARGGKGLEGAARGVRAGGGTALPLQGDTSRFEELKGAAQRVEEELGPIDVWVNVAFTSVFAHQPHAGAVAVTESMSRSTVGQIGRASCRGR